jgi:hypothetical protein
MNDIDGHQSIADQRRQHHTTDLNGNFSYQTASVSRLVLVPLEASHAETNVPAPKMSDWIDGWPRAARPNVGKQFFQQRRHGLIRALDTISKSLTSGNSKSR